MTRGTTFGRWTRLSATSVLCAALLSGGAEAASEATRADMSAAHAVLAGMQAGDPGAARDALHAHAEAGELAAMRVLASVLYSGRGVSRDVAAARAWWQRAAALGDADAAFNAGLLALRDGADRDAALAWLESAADAGQLAACFALGTLLADDPAGEQAARRYLERAARGGYAPAQFNLAMLLARAGDSGGARQWLSNASTVYAPAATALAALSAEEPAAPPAAQPAAPAAPSAAGIHGVDWVLSRPPAHYTLQVSAGREPDALERMLAREMPHTDSAWFMHRPRASEPYSAIVGSYPDYATAKTALARLPASLKSNAPWIRRFEILQGEVAQAAAARE